MIPANIFHTVYEHLAHKRVHLYVCVVVALLLSLAFFCKAPIHADIKEMIPQGKNGILVRDLDRISRSGLANIIFISVHTSSQNNKEQLMAGADTLTKSLSAAGLTFTDHTAIRPDKVILFLLDKAPNLMTKSDLARLEKHLPPANIRASLEKDVHILNTPQGVGMKEVIRRDPLEFHTILVPRLKGFATLSQAQLTGRYMFSPDGTAILLSARSSVPLTDANASNILLKHFEDAKKELPPEISADIISGHVHANANARIIKSDLFRISIVGGAALGLLFIVFFRTRHALGVFLTPLVSICAGLGCIALLNETVSAIVIGFGAVIAGISIDFAMHIYFAIVRHPEKPGKAVDAVAPPILFCFLTSCAAFGALFLSGMPGMRQLALFSIAALVASMLFSFFVLPHLSRKGVLRRTHALRKQVETQRPVYMLALLATLATICLYFGISATLDPDIRSIGYIPEEVRKTETDFTNTWGDIRNKALLFTQGQDLTTTLSQNEQVYKTLSAQFHSLPVASIAPVVPAFATQENNRKHWKEFWTKEKVDNTTLQLQKLSQRAGFSSTAFAPFIQSLDATPARITPNDLRAASLGLLTDIFLPDLETGDPTIVTYVPDSKDVRDFFSAEKEKALGVRLISGNRFKSMLEATMKYDITIFILVSGFSVVLLSFILFRNVRKACIALLPPCLGVCAIFGGLGFIGVPLNLFHITALPLVIGLGADYGIFLVSSETHSLKLDTIPAVAVSGLTTLAGFGVLVLARHPSLHAMGTTVLLGVGTALCVALFLVPQLLRRQ